MHAARQELGGSTLILVDADVAGDHRVLRSLTEAAGTVDTIDIRQVYQRARRVRTALAMAVTLARAIRRPLARYRILSDRLAGRVSGRFLAGMPAALRWTIRAARAAQAVRGRMDERQGERFTLHAHDLYCGVAAALAKGSSDVHLVYDAHELEIHRNRKAGWLRILVEHGLEQFVLGRADEVRVVNRAISTLMREWYAMPATPRVTYNDFYPTRGLDVPAPTGRPAIVYVGMGINGRQLQALDRSVGELGFDVHVYFLGARMPPHMSGAGWAHGPTEYEPHLLELVRRTRCLMWCCLDNECLSYQLATPNKFFQALALGLPIIASPRTYLADIVEAHGIGTVYTGNNLDVIALDAMSGAYDGWARRVRALNAALQDGTVVL